MGGCSLQVRQRAREGVCMGYSLQAVLGLAVEDCPALPPSPLPTDALHQSLLKLLSEVSLRVKNCALEILGSCSCPLLADHSGKATKWSGPQGPRRKERTSVICSCDIRQGEFAGLRWRHRSKLALNARAPEAIDRNLEHLRPLTEIYIEVKRFTGQAYQNQGRRSRVAQHSIGDRQPYLQPDTSTLLEAGVCESGSSGCHKYL